MIRPALFAALLGLVACSPRPSPGSAPAASPAVAAPNVADVPPDCRTPELWLALYPRDEVAGPYCQACGEYCDTDEQSSRMRWKLLSGDMLRFGCADLEYAQRAILAYHGVAVTDEPWASYFAGLPWYRPASSPKPIELPPAARANAAWLATVLEVCERTHENGIAREYVDEVREWFRRKREGDIRLPPKLFVDQQAATRERFLEFLSHGGGGVFFEYDVRTPVLAEVADERWRSLFLGRTVFAVTVATGAPTLSCVDSSSGIDCEGYESLTFFFDASSGELIGLDASAAG